MQPALAVLSLRGKVVALSVGVVVGVAAILFVELPRAVDAHSRDWIVSRSLGLGRLLGSAVEAAVDFEDPAAAQAALTSLERSRGAAYAVLRRGSAADGEAIARWGSSEVPPPLAGQAEAAEITGGLLHVRIPIATRSGRTATLRLGFTLDELEQRRAETRASVLRATGLTLVAGLIGAVLLATLILRPLQRMTAAAQGIADDDEAAARHLPVARRDEIGALAQAFARMLERLYAQRAQVRAELARTNEALAALARTQEQLVLADRRVSVGRLAAGVAHEVNNPLTFVRGNVDYIASELPRVGRAVEDGDRATARDLLAEMGRAAADVQAGTERVTSIVRGLKTFARDDDDTRRALDVVEPLEAAIEMAFHEIKHRARLVRSFHDAPRVLGNEVRLSQVFLNLLLNAAQAIPDAPGGKQEIICVIGTDAHGDAYAEITDTGSGIPPEIQARIFDPFFTTKPVGVGSGLGLSISRNIVEQLGGSITAQSAPGQGTTFRVTLPAAPQAAPVTSAPPARGTPAPELPGLRVLVVDDEPLLGDVVRRAIPEVDVTSVTSAADALERLQGGARYDRILCDVMMPGMSGPELYETLPREVRDRVIFMTGGAFTDLGCGFVERWRGPLLMKPFESATLRRMLHAPVT
jgi:signal transduction histidine kinase/CheY-like chemotaxis protein